MPIRHETCEFCGTTAERLLEPDLPLRSCLQPCEGILHTLACNAIGRDIQTRSDRPRTLAGLSPLDSLYRLPGKRLAAQSCSICISCPAALPKRGWAAS